MNAATYPEPDRAVLEQVVSDPRFSRIATPPTFAWQEILLIAGCYASLLASCLLYLDGVLPYVAAFAINALAIYAIFTPLHDATHGSLSKNRFINDTLGTLAALPLFPGFTTGIYRYLHLQHHRHTGAQKADPDEVTVSVPMPWKPIVWAFLDIYWIVWYARRIRQRPKGEVARAVASASFFVGWHAAWLLSPFAWEFILLWLLPQRAGITFLVYLFAAMQHPEGVRQAERPLQATRMFRGGAAIRFLTLSQSQHLMHHMFPTVPYYRYNQAWALAYPLLGETEVVWSWPFGRLRHPAASRTASPRAVLKARVADVTPVCRDVRAYTLEPAGGDPFPDFTPGAHISVHVAPGVVRQYSLVDPPRADGRYRIGVKLEAAGRGGSQAVHERFSVGTVVDIEPPRNLFPLSAGDRSVQLVAGGIGITPLLAMAEALHAGGTDFTLHVAASDRTRLPFAETLVSAPFADRVRIYLDTGDAARSISASDLPEWSDGQAMYLCGPRGLMAHVETLARHRGWPTTAVHTESFVAANPGPEVNRPFQVVLARSRRRFDVPAERSLLDVLQEHHLPVPASCVQGICGTCVCSVLEGDVDHRDVVLSDEARRNGHMTACVSRAAGDRLVLDL